MQHILYEFIFFSVFFFVASWFLRTIDWPVLDYDIVKWLNQKYLKHLMQIDNSYIESLGTGRMIATMTSGIKMWVSSLIHLLSE